MRYGYKASAEQFAPRELLDYSRLAEELGLETIAISDHFQPWRHHGGHTPAVLPWLGAIGERTTDALLGTSVLTPTMRYHPSIVAQNFATLAYSARGRLRMVTGPPPENAAILRSDRLYDANRLRRAIDRGRDPESAVIWRLDRPQGLDGAEDELIRRRTYQPVGRYWALAPARWLAETLSPTRVRPNAVTIASATSCLRGGGGMRGERFGRPG